MSCPLKKNCTLYPRFVSGAALHFWKTMYCDDPAHVDCERFKLAEAGSSPADDLLPNGTTLALSPDDER